METQDQKLLSVNYGGSLPIKCVQDLASKNQTEIPPRYLRPETELDPVSVIESLELPIIDMTKLIGDNQHQWHHDELAKLHLACKEWGFFQLINHEVHEEIIEKVKIDIEEFSKLSLVTKKDYAQQPNDIEGYGQAYIQFEEQKKLDWGDALFLRALPVSLRNMRYWPTQPISFRENLDKYSREVQKVALCVLKFMSRNLGLDSDTLSSKFEDGRQAIRINFYPPCVEANKVMGLTPHSDATGLTLLLQVNDVQGLQINKNGKWILVKPVPGAFIVNIGDIIEIMSNGEYKSMEHRVVVNPMKQRLSIAAFHGPHAKDIIGPLQDLVTKSKAKYKTIITEDYLKLVFRKKLDGKSQLDFLKE